MKKTFIVVVFFGCNYDNILAYYGWFVCFNALYECGKDNAFYEFVRSFNESSSLHLSELCCQNPSQNYLSFFKIH